MMIRNSLLIAIAILISALPIFAANQFTVTGKIIDAESKTPVPGATIKIIGTKKGTYSTPQGKFRLPLDKSNTKLKIVSLGYHSITLDVSESDHDSLFIMLKPNSIMLKGATVFGDITADLVIKRAIERKEENVKSIKTMSGLLYSKVAFELDGSVFGSANTDGNSLSIGGAIGEKAPEKFKMFLLETFSNTYQDYEKKKFHSEIIQRRQTSNIKPQDNIMALGNFITFYNDRIQLLNAEITTPLSTNAFSYYNFKLIEKTVLDDRYVYVVEVDPNTTTFPAFKGTIKIVEGTYNLVEVDLKPSAATAISFVSDLHIIQKFEEIQKDLWSPTYLDITGKAKVDVVKKLMDVSMNVRATSIYSEIKVNEPLPDSIYREETRRVAVAPKADSAKKEFWEENALREISPKEEKMYTQVDSLVKIDSVKTDPSTFKWNWISPYFDFNRVGSVSLGWAPSMSMYNFNISTSGYFSFGQQRLFGEAKISYPFKLTENSRYWLTPSLNIFSKIETISFDDSYPRLVNTAFSALFHYDYFDYVRNDGWVAGLTSYVFGMNISAFYEQSRQFSLERKTNKSIFTNKPWRANPIIDDGNYELLYFYLKIPRFAFIDRSSGIKLNLNAFQMLGKNKDDNTSFAKTSAEIEFSAETFKTGYSPMVLELFVRAGISNGNVPLQYESRMATSLFLVGKFGNFYSAPMAEYGGDEFYEYHAKFNLTDLWWRAIGLPLYEGRGVDLILAGSAGRYFHSNGYYKQTGGLYYSEAGFGLGRIPTFISNVFFLGADFRWGLDSIARGRFGGAVTITFPF